VATSSADRAGSLPPPARSISLLLDRGADPQARSRAGDSGAWGAIAGDNWPAARLLIQRGSPTDGRSPMGRPMVEMLEGYVRDGGRRGEGAATVLAEIGKRK
jgi:ankyrin repeat protein